MLAIWNTGGGGTRSTVNTRCVGVGISGVGAVEPEHVDCVVIPDTKEKGYC